MKAGSMKTSSHCSQFVFVISAILFVVSSIAGQAQAPATDPTAPTSAAAAQKGTTLQGPAPAQMGAPVLAAKLSGSLSTKTAKVGDPVTAKTIATLKLSDGVEIPKGSRIVGSVVAVKSAQDGGGTSALALKIDQVEMKNGKFMRIAGLITAIGPFPDAVGLGYDSVLGRGGVGSTAGLDPAIGAGPAVNRGDPDIPKGSTLDGVKLGAKFDAERATELRGVKRDIRLDSSVMIKVALYRTTAG
ncbi:MAG: hypothetical protein ABSF28_16550 [Terracidiphilus sp.]|jgi:hypothetical protein